MLIELTKRMKLKKISQLKQSKIIRNCNESQLDKQVDDQKHETKHKA